MAAASRRAQRRRSSARVMRVVPTDRTIVAATIAAMAHGGKCAGTVAGGGSGGTGAKEGVGGVGAAHAAGARPMGNCWCADLCVACRVVMPYGSR